MSLKYLICIDIEATCWEDTHTSYTKENAEIIEFPAVLLNLETGIVEAEFSHYVRPTEFPQLSNFCKNLTGITQADVDKADFIKVILKSFDEWIKRFSEEKNFTFRDDGDKKQNVAICTWSDCDIGVYLKGECQRKDISLQDYFHRRIDARQIYQKYAHRYRNIKFTHALSNMGIHFRGRLHSGIDDARNLSRMMVKIAKTGYKLHITNFDL